MTGYYKEGLNRNWLHLVSEAGYSMEEEALQFIIRHLNGLKTDIINMERTDINVVYYGQEEVKSEIRPVRNDIENSISAVKDEINAGQEELRQEISVFRRE
jgi:hypothetical protein